MKRNASGRENRELAVKRTIDGPDMIVAEGKSNGESAKMTARLVASMSSRARLLKSKKEKRGARTHGFSHVFHHEGFWLVKDLSSCPYSRRGGLVPGYLKRRVVRPRTRRCSTS